MNHGAESQQPREPQSNPTEADRPRTGGPLLRRDVPRAGASPDMIQSHPLLSPLTGPFRAHSPDRLRWQGSPRHQPTASLSGPTDLPWTLPPINRHQRTHSLVSSAATRNRSPETALYPQQTSQSRHRDRSPLLLQQQHLQSFDRSHRPSFAHSRTRSQAQQEYMPGPSIAYGLYPPPPQALPHAMPHAMPHYYQQQPPYPVPPRPLAYAHQPRDHPLGQYSHHAPSYSSSSNIFLPPLPSPVEQEDMGYSPHSDSSRGSLHAPPARHPELFRRTSTGAFNAESSAAGSTVPERELPGAARFNFKREILTRNGMTIGSWTRDESNELMVLVDGFKQVEPNMAIPWTSIGRQLRHPRTGAQCHAHYTEALDPKILKGRWNSELDAELLRLAALHDNSWVKVSAELPNKTQRQCRSRWVALLRKTEREQAKAEAARAAAAADASSAPSQPSGSEEPVDVPAEHRRQQTDSQNATPSARTGLLVNALPSLKPTPSNETAVTQRSGEPLLSVNSSALQDDEQTGTARSV